MKTYASDLIKDVLNRTYGLTSEEIITTRAIADHMRQHNVDRESWRDVEEQIRMNKDHVKEIVAEYLDTDGGMFYE